MQSVHRCKSKESAWAQSRRHPPRLGPGGSGSWVAAGEGTRAGREGRPKARGHLLSGCAASGGLRPRTPAPPPLKARCLDSALSPLAASSRSRKAAASARQTTILSRLTPAPSSPPARSPSRPSPAALLPLAPRFLPPHVLLTTLRAAKGQEPALRSIGRTRATPLPRFPPRVATRVTCTIARGRSPRRPRD